MSSAGEQRATILTGDCLGVLADMDADTFHACVTDPPYGLAFMGRDWDDFEPREYQQWCGEWAREVKRVLKPGGHLLAFSGNRTHHRLFTGVEDAGFEIRDTLTWHYGCLSEDTEVLTPEGWRTHDEISDGDDVIAFDPDTEQFNVEKTNRLFRYDHDGKMVRFKSADTDQLVTPNHRVLHRLDDEWKTSYAGEFYGYTELPVIHGTRENTTERTRRNGGSDVYDVREKILQAARPGGREQLLRGELLPRLEKHVGGVSRTSERDSAQGGTVGGVSARVVGEHEGREQSRMERRRDRKEAKGELQAGDTGSVPRRVRGDGPGERVRARASVEGGEGTRAAAHLGESGTSQGPRQSQQRLRESGTLAEQPTTQVGRGRPRKIPVGTTLARTSRVEYSGTVWCVQVPSSYFVARRNKQVFITGNSGFPKASDISKTIDKRADAEREVVGTREANDVTSGNYGQSDSIDADKQGERTTYEYTKPATDAAKRWDGFKTGLKPATEYVVMARKPFDGATVDCVLEHGTGALNIDGARVGTEERTNPGQGTADGVDYGAKKYESETVEGRYPSNVIFDEVEAQRLDEQVGETGSGGGQSRDGDATASTRYTDDGGTDFAAQPGQRRGDSGGPSRYFYTSKASRAERTLDGRIENAHPTVKPADLMEWLVTLVTAGDQAVLDPFAGSGTTCRAAKDLGRQFVGIEQDPKWADVARVRCGLTPDDPSCVRGDSSQRGLEAYGHGGDK